MPVVCHHAVHIRLPSSILSRDLVSEGSFEILFRELLEVAVKR
jgi:hypothetical protein